MILDTDSELKGIAWWAIGIILSVAGFVCFLA